MSDLSEAQNERLRRAMEAAIRERYGTITALGRKIGRSQPSLSAFLSGKGGASYTTALRFAKLVGVDVIEIIGEKRNGAALPAPFDPPWGALLLRIYEWSELNETLREHPGRWRVSTVVRAVHTKFVVDNDGVPVGGWVDALDALQSGAADATFGTTAEVVAETRRPRRETAGREPPSEPPEPKRHIRRRRHSTA